MADDWENFDWGSSPTPTANEPTMSAMSAPASASSTPGLKAKSWGSTNMPTFWSDWAKNYFGGDSNRMGLDKQNYAWSNYFAGGPKYQGQIDQNVNRLNDFWGTYQQLPGQIENKRKTLIDQIYANLPQMRELYQPTMEGMSQRGILNSSITGDALAEIQKGVNRDIGSQVAGANTWAADQNIAHTTNTPAILQSIMSGITGASNQNMNFGQTSANVASNQQQLVNSLLELMRNQTQGSETYNV